MSPSSTAAYSYNWALDRVKELYGKYPRATKYVANILEINPQIMARMLANRDPAWSGLKDLIHRTDVWTQIGNNGDNYYTYVEYIRTHIQYFSKLECSERLTGRIHELMLEEQLMKGGNRRPSADDSLPTSPDLPKVVDDGYGPQLCFRFNEAQSAGA